MTPTELLAGFGYSNGSTAAVLFLAALLGGIVRGFTGFGFAMVFVPVAALAVGPVKAVALIWCVDVPFAWPLALSGLRRADWREVVPLIIGAVALVPLGGWLLLSLDPTLARWIIAVAILIAVVLLATGWRYRGRPGLPLSLGVGGFSGLASGMAQLGGMPIALFWLAAQTSNPGRMRNNLNAFFCIMPVASGIVFWWSGILTAEILWMAAPLWLPYGLGLFAGTKGFDRASEALYRRAAFSIIILAALVSLPVLDPWLRTS